MTYTAYDDGNMVLDRGTSTELAKTIGVSRQYVLGLLAGKFAGKKEFDIRGMHIVADIGEDTTFKTTGEYKRLANEFDEITAKIRNWAKGR